MLELSKSAEDRLIATIRNVVHLVDEEGLDPTSAIVKAADDGSWSPHFVQRICESYNIGRQESQRKTASRALDKFAEFELADASAAIAKLFPSGPIKQADAIADDYAAPPSWLPDLRPKPASVLTPVLEKSAAVLDTKPAPSVSTKIAELRQTTQNLEVASQDVTNAKEELRRSLSKLGSYFRQSSFDRVPFAFTEKVAEAYYPGEARLILNYIHEKHCKADKRADANYLPPGRVDRNQRPFNLLTECVEGAQKLATAGQKLAEAQTAREKAASIYAEAREALLGPFSQDPLSPELFLPMTGKAAGLVQMATGMGVGAAVKSLADDTLKGIRAGQSTPEQLVERDWLALEDPGHDEELRKIRVQAMLTDLMSHDDVISKHPPETVLSKFNELQGLMPSLAAQPAAMRPYLRRALQGHLEPFEAHEMAKLQSTVHPSEAHSPLALELKRSPMHLSGRSPMRLSG